MYIALLWIITIFFSMIAVSSVIYSLTIATSFNQRVPYVPLPRKSLAKALELLDLQEGDRFIDIGSGDGQVLGKAMEMYQMPVEFFGIETKRILIWFSNLLYKNKGATFLREDALKHNYSEYNKVFLYMTYDFNELLAPKLLKELKPGSRLVSCHFDFGGEFTKKYMKEVSVGKNKLYIWDVK